MADERSNKWKVALARLLHDHFQEIDCSWEDMNREWKNWYLLWADNAMKSFGERYGMTNPEEIYKMQLEIYING